MTRRSKPRPRWMPPGIPLADMLPRPRLSGVPIAIWGVYGLAQIVPVAPWNVIWDEWRVNGWPK